MKPRSYSERTERGYLAAAWCVVICTVIGLVAGIIWAEGWRWMASAPLGMYAGSLLGAGFISAARSSGKG